MKITKVVTAVFILLTSTLTTTTHAADYIIDTKGAHAAINFKINHVGFSWLTGRFNQFTGNFSYDPKNILASKVNVDIDVSSIDSNHVKRDKHLRSDDFLDTAKFPNAKFVSTTIVPKSDDTFDIIGDLTLHGVTKNITIAASKVGEGEKWGGYRAGFEGTTILRPADFGIDYDLGPKSATLELELLIEGIQQ